MNERVMKEMKRFNERLLEEAIRVLGKKRMSHLKGREAKNLRELKCMRNLLIQECERILQIEAEKVRRSLIPCKKITRNSTLENLNSIVNSQCDSKLEQQVQKVKKNLKNTKTSNDKLRELKKRVSELKKLNHKLKQVRW